MEIKHWNRKFSVLFLFRRKFVGVEIDVNDYLPITFDYLPITFDYLIAWFDLILFYLISPLLNYTKFIFVLAIN